MQGTEQYATAAAPKARRELQGDRALSSVHADTEVSKRGMRIMNLFINGTFERIATEGARLTRYIKRNTRFSPTSLCSTYPQMAYVARDPLCN